MELTKTYSDIAEYGEKYHFYHNVETGVVVCTRLYKGQIIRGTAKCDPKDRFDIETGKKLAYLRCKHKLLHKKLKRAKTVHAEAIRECAKTQNAYRAAEEFMHDVVMQLDTLDNELIKFEYTL